MPHTGRSGTAAHRGLPWGERSGRVGWVARSEHVGSAVVTDDVEVALGGQRLTKVAVRDDDALRVIERARDHLAAGRHDARAPATEHVNASGNATGKSSGNAPARAVDPGMTVARLAELIAVGGWPAQQGAPIRAAAQAAIDYLHQICTVDVGRVADPRRDPSKVEALVRSLARNVATEVAITTLAADAGGADGDLSRVTVSEYLRARAFDGDRGPAGMGAASALDTSAQIVAEASLR